MTNIGRCPIALLRPQSLSAA